MKSAHSQNNPCLSPDQVQYFTIYTPYLLRILSILTYTSTIEDTRKICTNTESGPKVSRLETEVHFDEKIRDFTDGF